jgi:plasmid stability protein
MPIVQIRDVPDDVHQVLTKRAALKGLSLSEHLREVLAREATRPPAEELLAELRTLEPAAPGEPSQVTIRRLRDALE